MKNKKTIFYILSLAIMVLFLNAGETLAQPTDAQLKKVLTTPKTVEVTLNGRGTIEWSKTYKKYIWTRYFTRKSKTDTPGEIIVVRGYAAYDVMDGRYVFWREFASDSSYEGKKNPTVAEINTALEKEDLTQFSYAREYVGEFESFRIAPEPDWEWHTANSVSFNVVAVYHVVNTGGRADASGELYQPPSGSKAIDRVESWMRLRLYRKDAQMGWNGVGFSHSIRNPDDRRYLKEIKKLLGREVLPNAQVERMSRISKIPLLTQ
jgi:hypothetical protein